MKDFKEIFDEAYLKYVKGSNKLEVQGSSDALFHANMKIKWERLCLEQQSFLPEVKKLIPPEWKHKLKGSNLTVLNFRDCSRELIETGLILL